MSDIVIKAENLGKKYIIGHQTDHGRYLALRDVLMQNARGFWHKTKDLAQGKPIIQGDTLEEVWALKDVSFEIQRGEAVGIIGRNGAGKSTLLKVLSRITEPSTGRVTIKGRVASLLEVGTGFHPELSGRENIYLNGAILGMTRQEIKRKFDEIVAFAEVERFLDTPVKRYSSGMYVRLAFAVAAHLEPEILVVDEVLAVGDAVFQKKCLGKMGDVAKEGRTVLFVSHNMDAVIRLCSTSFLLMGGLLQTKGPSSLVVEEYLSNSSVAGQEKSMHFDFNSAKDKLIFRSVSLVHQSPETDLTCCIEYEVFSRIDCVIAVRVDSAIAVPVATLTDVDQNDEAFSKVPGKYIAKCTIPVRFMNSGIYRITISAADMKSTRYDYHEGVLNFEVLQSALVKTTFRREGPLLVPSDWHTEAVGIFDA